MPAGWTSDRLRNSQSDPTGLRPQEMNEQIMSHQSGCNPRAWNKQAFAVLIGKFRVTWRTARFAKSYNHSRVGNEQIFCWLFR
jgi:hypothetical protein